ncbi:MAG: PilT/PilU family type 4a pilus ATPase [Actinomycetota bacterium]|nr:PilT/PilU family type 4a pilus ATPase [Actinomycetota bacterium]
MLDLNELLRHAAERRASDVHLSAGCRPWLRLDGEVAPTPFDVLDALDTEHIVRTIMPLERAEQLARTGEVDFGYAVGGGRFRVRVFRQRGTLGLVLRVVPEVVPGFDTLGLPPAVRRLADEPRGLVLVTGSTGSGKTTTVAAIVDHINETAARHIVTLEDPVEFVHTPKRSFVTQREVGTDAPDQRSGLRGVLRLDADVLVIGDLTDVDSVRVALSAAAAGHLVIAALPATTTTEAVTRIVDLFPSDEQRAVRTALAGCLRWVVSQRLLERVDGKGRIPAVEVLMGTGRVFDKIVNADETGELEQVIAEGEYYGMQTFDQSLFGLHKNGLIGLRDALAAASHPHELRIALQQAGFPVGNLDPVAANSW